MRVPGRISFVLLLSLLLAGPGFAQAGIPADAPERVDSLLAEWTGDVPGAVVAVVRDGRVVFARGYGLANLAHGVPFTVETRTNIGSTTKQFTAYAIALLAERGELSLDDDVRDHIPELPAFDEPVTLRHLLTHTSGYREVLNTLVLAGRRIDAGDQIAREESLEVVQRQTELQNTPGSEWNYNNTGYVLAGMVVERVSGTPFPEWLRENVFLPLGMENTLLRESAWQVVENSAQGYVPAPEDGFLEAPDLSGAPGAGGIYTTVGDLALWIHNFETGALGGPAIYEAMTEPYVLTTGDTTSYGLGLFVDELRGTPMIHHGGADIAHRSMMAWYPEADLGVITLSNFAGFPGTVHREVSELFLGDLLEPEAPPADAGVVETAASFDPESYDPAAFDALAGRYALDEAPAFVLSFYREDETLYTRATGQSAVEIRPVSETRFALVGVEAEVEFHTGPEGEVSHLTLYQNGEHRATPLEEEVWSPSAAELSSYTGRFYSDELETFYTVTVEEDALVVRHRRFADVELQPDDEEDTFTGSFPIGTIEFVRAEDGRVTALLVGNTRALDIRFERVE